jgi:kynurenine formamidase
MLVDLSTKVSKKIAENMAHEKRLFPFGHLGTHFDVMDKEFPLAFTKRKGIVFDVSDFKNKDIELDTLDLKLIESSMFVAFYTGFARKVEYGTKQYFKEHPQLSFDLIDNLLAKTISIIGVDFAGVRRGVEHTPTDQRCADKGVFIVENICNLENVLNGKKSNYFIANTYPINFEGMSGLPCRVIAEV